MSKETDYNEPHIVWYGIVSLFQFTQKYAAALRAYGEVYGDKGSGNVYIDLSQEVIWRQLLSEISKIYDKEKDCLSLELVIKNKYKTKTVKPYRARFC